MKNILILILSFFITNKSIGQISDVQIKKWAMENNVNSTDSFIKALAVNLEFNNIIKTAEIYLKERKKVYEENKDDILKIKAKLSSDLSQIYSSADFHFIRRRMKDTSEHLFIETLQKPFFNKNLDLEIALKSTFEKSKEERENVEEEFAYQIKHINNCILVDSTNSLYRYRKGLILYYFGNSNSNPSIKKQFCNKSIAEFNYCIKKYPKRAYYYKGRIDAYKSLNENINLIKEDFITYLDLTKEELNNEIVDYDIILTRIETLIDFNQFEKAKSELIKAKELLDKKNKTEYTFDMIQFLDNYEKYFEEDYFKNNFVSKCIPLNLEVTKEYYKIYSSSRVAEQVNFMLGAEPKLSNFRNFCIGKSDKSIFQK